MKTDVDIQEAIGAALTRDPRVRSKSEGGAILFRVHGGTVLLEGITESLIEKRVAEQVVARVEGVSRVENRLRVRAMPQRTDEVIAMHVRNALTEDPYLSERDLVITVQAGVVKLSGHQDALAKKRLAGLVAWWVPGVTDVENAIAVVPDEEDSDQEILTSIRVAFDKDKLVDALRFHVEVLNGHVTLYGLARSEAERNMAEEDVWMTWGVQGVENRVEIEGP
ncbi:periplasmic protein [compost metagenome]